MGTTNVYDSVPGTSRGRFITAFISHNKHGRDAVQAPRNVLDRRPMTNESCFRTDLTQ